MSGSAAVGRQQQRKTSSDRKKPWEVLSSMEVAPPPEAGAPFPGARRLLLCSLLFCLPSGRPSNVPLRSVRLLPAGSAMR